MACFAQSQRQAGAWDTLEWNEGRLQVFPNWRLLAAGRWRVLTGSRVSCVIG